MKYDTHTHLFPGAVVSRGASNDSPQFPEAMTQAVQHVPFHRILVVAAHDSEHNHRLCREELGIRLSFHSTEDADQERPKPVSIPDAPAVFQTNFRSTLANRKRNFAKQAAPWNRTSS